MKMLALLFSIFMVVVSFACGAMPPVGVTVVDAGGKVAFKGKTNAAGAFATGRLTGGEYSVQFNGSLQGNYALLLSAGKEKATATSVAGEKFGGGGVAVKVKVGKDMHISGRVTNARAGALASADSTKVKIVNGKRWFWVTSSTGSNLGAHWVEEGTVEARNMGTYSKTAINNLQEKGRGAPNE